LLHPEQGIENKTISRFHEKIDVGSTGIVDNKPIQALFPFARMFTDTRNAMYTLAFALFLAFIFCSPRIVMFGAPVDDFLHRYL